MFERRFASSRGFAIIAAIVILVILSALAGFVVSLTAAQNVTLAQDIQSARALQTARAGLEWGAATWLNSGSCTTTSAFSGTVPICSPGGASAICTQRTLYSPSSSNPTGLTNFTLLVSMCQCPAPPSGTTCQITATASAGSLGSLGFVERQVMTVLEGD